MWTEWMESNYAEEPALDAVFSHVMDAAMPGPPDDDEEMHGNGDPSQPLSQADLGNTGLADDDFLVAGENPRDNVVAVDAVQSCLANVGAGAVAGGGAIEYLGLMRIPLADL